MICMLALLLLVLGVWLTISQNPGIKRIYKGFKLLKGLSRKKQYLSGGGKLRPPQGNYWEE
jgi:hypothetical protein